MGPFIFHSCEIKTTKATHISPSNIQLLRLQQARHERQLKPHDTFTHQDGSIIPPLPRPPIRASLRNMEAPPCLPALPTHRAHKNTRQPTSHTAYVPHTQQSTNAIPTHLELTPSPPSPTPHIRIRPPRIRMVIHRPPKVKPHPRRCKSDRGSAAIRSRPSRGYGYDY